MIKVKVEKLQKSFGSLEVLKGIDLEVKEGEVVCLIGPSGSGKSTFHALPESSGRNDCRYCYC